MIQTKIVYELLKDKGVDFFTGVPDSLLKDFCAYVTDNTKKEKHVITANEGNAIALAAGYHLATEKIGLVYLQNSGLGNTINPLTSLADPEVYSIPMLLMIGWRGEPGVKDEPQHMKKGRITQQLLQTLDIPFAILPDTTEAAKKTVQQAVESIKKRNAPFAILVKKGIFEEYTLQNKERNDCEMTREEAVKEIVNMIDDKSSIVATTGMLSRELFEYREQTSKKHDQEFLTVGSMGHASQIALGIALANKNKKVYCLDGDGAAIMHLGGMTVIGTQAPKNLIHILLNNGAHDSVGGQPTTGFAIHFTEIAKACGYKQVAKTEKKEEIKQIMNDMNKEDGPHFLEIKIKTGHRKDLGRPTTKPIENKEKFMQFLKK